MDNKTYPGKHPKSVQKRDKLPKHNRLYHHWFLRKVPEASPVDINWKVSWRQNPHRPRGVVIGIANRSEHGHGACEKRHSLHPVFQLQFSSYDRISPMQNLTLIHRMWRRVWISERDFPWGFARDLQFLRRLAYQQRLDDSCCLLALKVSMVFLEGNFELGISWVVVC